MVLFLFKLLNVLVASTSSVASISEDIILIAFTAASHPPS